MKALKAETEECEAQMLGTVDKNGVIRFSGDINDCRDFLRSLGLEIESGGGWIKPGWLGSLTFWQGCYHAAASQSDLA